MNFNELLSICKMDQKISIHFGTLENSFYLRGTKDELLKSGSTFDSLSQRTVKEIEVEKHVLKVLVSRKDGSHEE